MKKLRKKCTKAAIVFLSLFTFAVWPTLTPILAAENDRGGRQGEQKDRNDRDRQGDRGDQNRPGPRPEGRVERDRPQPRPPVVVERDRPQRPPARVVVPARPARIPAPRQVRVYPEGRAVVRLPIGYRSIRVGGHDYYHHNGIFYRRGPSGYLVVRPPFGAVVLSLPLGFAALVLAGVTYYLYEGIYYQRVPSGYVVVEPPVGAVATPVTPVVPANPMAGDKVVVTTPLLNVRSGPGPDFPVIAQVRQGDPLVVYGYAPDWLYVQLPGGGEYGWVMVIHTAPVSPPASG